MILVYCEHITPRHRFIFDFIFKDIMGSAYELTDNREQLLSSPYHKINYSSEEIPGIIQFQPHGLLAEQGTRSQSVKVGRWEGLPVFFQVESPSEWPYDPFAMAFYLVSRYEEYLPFEADEHGRFIAENSTAYRENFIHVPLVDVIAHKLKGLLEVKFPGLRIPCQTFSFIPSFDIDIAYAHLGKGWARAAAAWAKIILKADFRQGKERISTLRGKITDPYDNFSLHTELAEKFGHQAIYFVLLGNFSRNDRNTSYKSKRFRKLITDLNLSAEIGLHPSYRSHLDPGLFEEEKKRLGNIIHKPVQKNRFHFLRLKFPESYRLIISRGITDDYSLGYSTVNGFRASTCTPFSFYDLQKEEITALKLHPFIFMDSAMIDHLGMTPGDGIREINNLVGQVEKYGGEAIGTWHNYSLCEKGHYEGWRDVLAAVLENFQKSRP